ncbi:MAG: hypothetical protein ACI8W8_003408 [Rhodothermales bacterium]
MNRFPLSLIAATLAFVCHAADVGDLKSGDSILVYTDSPICDRSPVKIDRFLGSYMRLADIRGIGIQYVSTARDGGDPVPAFQQTIGEGKPTRILLYHGYQSILNGKPSAELEPTLLAMLGAAQAAGSTVTLLTHIPHVNPRYAARNEALMNWNEQIRVIAKKQRCPLVDLHRITLDKMTALFPEKPGDFTPAFDYRQYNVGVLGGLIENEALIKAMGFSVENEAALLALMSAPHPKGYQIRFGDAYQATLPLKAYAALRALPIPQKETVVARCNAELIKLIEAAYAEASSK